MSQRSNDRAALSAEALKTSAGECDPVPVVRRKAVVILNSRGGGVARIGEAEVTAQIVTAFAAHGVAAEVIRARGRAVSRIARQHVGPADMPRAPAPLAVIAAGGDGTVCAVAQVLADSTVPLGILPLGTLNHFARDLGLPVDIASAVAVIAAGRSVAVDAAEVNGRIFVNNSSIGLYPNMVRDRDRQLRQNRRAKWLAMALALFRVLRHPMARRLTIEAGDLLQPYRTPFAFIGNNIYATTLPTLGQRAALDGGELCLYIAKPRGPLGVVRLMLRAAFGRLDQTSDFERRIVTSLAIHSRHRRLSISLDGEVLRLRTPLRYRTRPGALRIFVPEAAER